MEKTGKKTVLTMTLNPALDLFYETDEVLDVDGATVFRTNRERFDAGGKGFNVGRALHAYRAPELQIENLVVTGGSTGKRWLRLAEETGCTVKAFEREEETRLNVHLNGKDQTAIKINGQAPLLDNKTSDQIMTYLGKAAPEVLVLSGNPPLMVDQDFISKAIRTVKLSGGTVLVDMTGASLDQAIEARCDLVKINEEEFKTISKPVDKTRFIITGGKGEIRTFGGQKNLKCKPTTSILNPLAVGAGDYFMAGIVAGLAEGLDEQASLELAHRFACARLTGKEPTMEWLQSDSRQYCLEFL